MFEWAYSGVNFSLAGNGGPECVNYLSTTWLVIETVFVCLFTIIFEIFISWYKLSFDIIKSNSELPDRSGRKFLLALLCLVWGIEVGFKFATSQLIFLLNPCHVMTFVQIILLAAPQRKWVQFLFRSQTYLYCGATLSLVFPVVNTRYLPYEVASYFIHHGLMLVIPFYLMNLGGVFTMEPLKNLCWPFMSIGILRVYHYLILQPISLYTEVNVNSIICPAISDPFSGPYWRIAAFFHATIFILVHGKLTSFIGMKYLAPKPYMEPTDSSRNKLQHESKI